MRDGSLKSPKGLLEYLICMCLLLYVVILQKIVEAVVWYCIQILSLFFIFTHLFGLQENQSVFILYDLEKKRYIKWNVSDR